MQRLAGYLISGSGSTMRKTALGVVITALLLAIAAWVATEQLAQNMRSEIDRSLAAYAGLRANLVETFNAMDAEATAEPCGVEFFAQLRRVAFRPDGINELLFLPNGQVACSVNFGRLAAPEALGQPSIPPTGAFGIALWLNRDLSFLGLDEVSGTIARRGNFGMVIPPQILPASSITWMHQQLVYRLSDGNWLHRWGTDGLQGLASAATQSATLQMLGGRIYQQACDPAGEHCVIGRSEVLPLLFHNWATAISVVLVVAVLSAWLTQQLCLLMERYWSFEQRFLRNFEKGAVLCAYQPLLDLQNDTIIGCEVLARWRDIDDTMVMPDRFLPLIEKHGLTQRFTAMVVARAYADLSPLAPSVRRFQINFNIFPQDLDAARLSALLAPFQFKGSPFELVVELVETAEVDPETAQIEIEQLLAEGIRTYLDDFGAGYSSMHNLAALSIAGVKLDRSFAMAPDHSVMARMLDHAIELVHASGRALVVEGVETIERLRSLKASGRVDIAQGYVVSRPLPSDALRDFLSDRSRSQELERLVA